MQTLRIQDDINVFGFEVKSFPNGVGEAFDKLVQMVPEGINRAYYGVSYMDDQGKVVYIAAVEEKNDDKPEANNCQKYSIPKGTYIAETLVDWMQNTDEIKDIFHAMINRPGVDLTKPCIEWYKSDDEMVCMMKLLAVEAAIK